MSSFAGDGDESDEESSSGEEYEYESGGDAASDAASTVEGDDAAAACLDESALEDAVARHVARARAWVGGSDDGAARRALRASGWDLGALRRSNDRGRVVAVAVAPPPGFSCAICYDAIHAAGFALACAHAFCGPCWRGYLRTTWSLDAVCPSAGCLRFVDDAAFRFAFGERSPEVARRRRAWAGDLVGARGAWCPRGCGRCVTLAPGVFAEADCDCGAEAFCGRCAVGDGHAPLDCGAAAAWDAKLAARRTTASEVESGARAEVKACPNPRCRCRVEKAGGCNYMVCASCSERWCWHCGSWGGGPSRRPPPHHLFFCNDPPTKFARLEDDGRLAFYAERAEAHAASRAHAKSQMAAAHARARAIADASPDPDASFLPEAVALVERCRGTLQWSYAATYGEADDGRRALLVFAQKQLEVYTEELSGLTEQKHAAVAKARSRIVFLTAALTKYRANIANWG